jgi:hypothetical protein
VPDLTLCTGEKCPIKLECYRYRAKPRAKQDYVLFHYNLVAEKCYYFMEIVNVARKNDGRLR